MFTNWNLSKVSSYSIETGNRVPTFLDDYFKMIVPSSLKKTFQSFRIFTSQRGRGKKKNYDCKFSEVNGLRKGKSRVYS